VESPVLSNGHAGFGRRAGETHRWKHRQGARSDLTTTHGLVDGSSVRARAHLPPSPLTRRPQLAGRARLRPSGTGLPSRITAVLTGAPVPFGRRPSARPAFRSLRARLRHEVPGFGADLIARPARVMDRGAGLPADRPSGSQAGCRWRDSRRPRMPARGQAVDRRDVFGCLLDREGSESPFSPHRARS